MNDLIQLENNNLELQEQLSGLKTNYINNTPLDKYIFNKLIYKLDPIEYIHNVLRAHLNNKKRYLFENQISLIRAVCNPSIRQIVCRMSRQAGKTESIASVIGFLADNYPGLQIGIFTPKSQQAEISLGRCSVFYQMNEELLNNKILKLNKGFIQLSNNASIKALSASDQSNIEGFTFDVIILDEAQKISDYTWSERIIPMGGATNAKLIQIGTPKFRNHFYDAFQNKSVFHIVRDWRYCGQLAANDSEPLMLPNYDNPSEMIQYPRYAFKAMPKALKQQLFPKNPEVWTDGTMSVEDFKTQYMLYFADGAGIFLSGEEVKQMVSGDFDWIYRGYLGETYSAGIDFAGAVEGDYTHITIVRKTPQGEKQKVWAKELQGVSYPEQMEIIARLFGGPKPRWNVKSIFADMTGCGYPVVQCLKDEYGLHQLTGIIFNQTDRYTNSGMNMKNVMLSSIKNDISRDLFKYPNEKNIQNLKNNDLYAFYKKMLEEWQDLEFENTMGINKKISAPKGQHDDVPMADALANFAMDHSGVSNMPRPTMGKSRRW